MVDKSHKMSVNQQCKLLSIHGSGFYYKPIEEKKDNLAIMQEIDKLHLRWPHYGVHKILYSLKEKFSFVDKKRIAKLMKKMGIEAIYPKKKTTVSNPKHTIYPYLLRNLKIERVNQVWATDITYITMKQGFMYLMVIIDVHSRYVLNWSISNTMDKTWCVSLLSETIAMHGTPEIFNTDRRKPIYQL